MAPLERPPPRPIKRLLIANRGEIANRIISSARELDIETFAIYTSDDISHTLGAAHSIQLSSPASYLNINELIQVAKQHGIDAVHPGYGFLSESEDFSKRMWDAGVAVVGPGWRILERTGDKLKARLLAEKCGVPVLRALRSPTNSIDELRKFATKVGYPIMIKAVDGGGGRGIRLVREEAQLQSNARRAIEESPSKKVFAEKAAVDGFLHVEVQIIGDGSGNVQHLWERQCSIQRRYQKVVEIAPCLTPKRQFIAKIIDSAVLMAQQVWLLFSIILEEWEANMSHDARSNTFPSAHSNSSRIRRPKSSSS
jgi:pyruvate carboxylase